MVHLYQKQEKKLLGTFDKKTLLAKEVTHFNQISTHENYPYFYLQTFFQTSFFHLQTKLSSLVLESEYIFVSQLHLFQQ